MFEIRIEHNKKVAINFICFIEMSLRDESAISGVAVFAMNANPTSIYHQESATQPPGSGTPDLRNIWLIFKRRWRILACAVIAGLAAMGLWLALTTPIYTATATVLIDPRKANAIKSDAIVSDLELDVNTIATEVSLVKSFSVSKRVADRLKLDTHPQFGLAAPKFSFIGWITGFFSGASEPDPGAPEVGGPRYLYPAETLKAIDRLKDGADARRLTTTYFIEISFSHSDAELAAKIANALAEAYLDEQTEARRRAGQKAVNWLGERLAALRIDLESSERALAGHRAKYNLARSQAGTLAEQQATEINAQLVAARALTVDKKAKYDEVQRILNDGIDIERVAAIMDSAPLNALRLQETTIARQEADLLTRYGSEHPAILKIRAEHADINKHIEREVGRLVQTLKTEYELAQKKEESLQSSMRELTASYDVEDQSMIRLRELERDVSSNRSLYETTLNRFKEAEQQMSLQGAESRIVAPAFMPGAPSFPKKWLFLLLGLFGGLVTGAGAIGVLEFLENGFTAASQIEQAFDLPVLAMIPMLSHTERIISGRIASIPEYAALKPQSHFGESIRSTRMITQMPNGGRPPKLILVTSSISAEGKTTIAMSLALSAAAAGKQRVLLIDCDLRARSLSKRFNLFDKPGLTDFLTGQVGEDRAVFRANIPNLTILPAGTTTANPPDILGSERMHTLLLELRENYDAIYLDAPPLLPVIDSVVLSNFAEKIVFVMRWRTTPRSVALRAVQLIENSFQKISGIAVNGADVNQLMNYDPSNSYYYNMYRSYYVQ